MNSFLVKLKKIPIFAALLYKPLPLIVALTTLVLGTLLVNSAGDYLAALPPGGPPLPDIIHDAIPPIDMNIVVSLLNVISISLCVLYFIFVQWKDIAKTFLIMGIYMLMRGCFLYMNVLPEPWPRIDDTMIIDIPGVFYGTRDLFPSGHSGSMFILCFMISVWKWFKYIIIVASLAIVTGVLLMHVHYTIDVAGALFIAYAVYSFVNKHWGDWMTLVTES